MMFLRLPTPVNAFSEFQYHRCSAGVFARVDYRSFLIIGAVVDRFRQRDFRKVTFYLDSVADLTRLLGRRVPTAAEALVGTGEIVR